MLKSTQRQDIQFISQLTQDIELLERLISENILENYGRIGAEQEFCLIDDNFRANPINDKIVTLYKTWNSYKETRRDYIVNVDAVVSRCRFPEWLSRR